MYMWKRTLRFAAVSAVTVLALTGFSTGGGSGCGGSRQDHDGSSAPAGPDGEPSTSPASSATSTEDSGGTAAPSESARRSPTPTASPSVRMKDGTAVLVRCANMDDPYATVEIRNPNGRDGSFTFRITFRSRTDSTVDETTIVGQELVPAKSTTTRRIFVSGANGVREPEYCAVDRRATFAW